MAKPKRIKPDVIWLKLEPEVGAALRDLAKRESRQLNDQLRHMLKQGLAAQQK